MIIWTKILIGILSVIIAVIFMLEPRIYSRLMQGWYSKTITIQLIFVITLLALVICGVFYVELSTFAKNHKKMQLEIDRLKEQIASLENNKKAD